MWDKSDNYPYFYIDYIEDDEKFELNDIKNNN